MKKVLKKLLICLIIFVLAFNFTFQPKVQADVTAQTAVQGIIDFISSVGDGILGLLTMWPKIQCLIAEIAIMGIMSLVATQFGYVDTNGDVVTSGGILDLGLFTPDDIFFNKIALTDINIFNLNEDLPDTILSIRTNIALWYYIMRTIAIAVLLAILVYIAINMAISTVASDKAEYKKMLVNWASSIALVFVLHYVIILICRLNSVFVSIFAGIYDALKQGTVSGIKGVYDNGSLDLGIANLLTSALSISATTGWASIVVVGMIIIQTFAFLIYYIKRMLTVSFLIIISPLITITYSIDKLGDGKAQALNTWLREFFFTVIIQPFHCVIYMVFMSLALSALGGTAGNFKQGIDIIYPFSGGIDSLVGGLLAILCIKFVWDAEKMVKNIFGIKVSEGLGDAVASAAIAGAVVSKGMNLGVKATGAAAKKVTTKVGANGGSLGGILKDASNALGNTKLGGKIKNSEFVTNMSERKKKKEFEKDKAYIKEQRALGSTKSTRELRDERRKKAEENKLSNRIKNNKTIKGFKNYLDENPNGMKLKRYLFQQSPAVAAAMLGGAMMYGASDKTSLFEAGIAGYGAYQGVSKGIETLRNRKTNNYEDDQRKDAKNYAMCNNNSDKYDKDANKYTGNLSATASRMGEEGELSSSKLREKKEDAKDELVEALNDAGYSGDAKEKADEIIEGVLNGIYTKNLNFNNIQADAEVPISAEQIQTAVADLAKTKILQNMYNDNTNINTLAGQEDFSRAVWSAHNNETETEGFVGERNVDWESIDEADQGKELGQLAKEYQDQSDKAVKTIDKDLDQMLASLKAAGIDTKDITTLTTKLEQLLADATKPDPVPDATVNLSGISGVSLNLNEDNVALMIDDAYSRKKGMTSHELVETVKTRIIEEHVKTTEVHKVTETEKREITNFITNVANHQAYDAANAKLAKLKS